MKKILSKWNRSFYLYIHSFLIFEKSRKILFTCKYFFNENDALKNFADAAYLQANLKIN